MNSSTKLVKTTFRIGRLYTQQNNLIRCHRNFSANAPKKTKNGNITKLALMGVAFGTVAGASVSIYENWRDKNAHMEHEKIPPKIIDKFPSNVKITKRFINPKDNSGLEVILFQFQTCPFCCKVRAFLDYSGISYSVVEVDAVLRQDIKWSEQKKVYFWNDLFFYCTVLIYYVHSKGTNCIN